jgi:hypothetical protein
MKALLLALSILILSIGLSANPVMPMILSEVWFTSEGHCMVEFYPEQNFWLGGASLHIKHNDVYHSLNFDFSLVPQDSTVVLDLNLLIPSLVLNPAVTDLQSVTTPAVIFG